MVHHNTVEALMLQMPEDLAGPSHPRRRGGRGGCRGCVRISCLPSLRLAVPEKCARVVLSLRSWSSSARRWWPRLCLVVPGDCARVVLSLRSWSLSVRRWRPRGGVLQAFDLVAGESGVRRRRLPLLSLSPSSSSVRRRRAGRVQSLRVRAARPVDAFVVVVRPSLVGAGRRSAGGRLRALRVGRAAALLSLSSWSSMRRRRPSRV